MNRTLFEAKRSGSRFARRHPRALSLSVLGLAVLAGASLVVLGPFEHHEPAGSAPTLGIVPPEVTHAPPLVLSGSGFGPSGIQGPVPRPGSCRFDTTYGLVLADQRCTPGAIDTSVDEKDLRQTVCRAQYAAQAQAPAPMRDKAFHELLAAYSVSASDASSYHLNYLVPLNLGGSNAVANLWPEPNEGAASDYDPQMRSGWSKDGVDASLANLVCHAGLSLAVAQRAVSSDWIDALSRVGGIAWLRSYYGTTQNQQP